MHKILCLSFTSPDKKCTKIDQNTSRQFNGDKVNLWSLHERECVWRKYFGVIFDCCKVHQLRFRKEVPFIISYWDFKQKLCALLGSWMCGRKRDHKISFLIQGRPLAFGFIEYKYFFLLDSWTWNKKWS